jgi:uncharacterized membrane protein YhiD involved in acid resistance
MHKMLATDAAPTHHSEGAARLLDGWRGFSDGWLLLDMACVLMLALALGALIAYHPTSRRKATSLEQLDQPKTFLMYSMVAAVAAQIVEIQPAMAFVIFGIGGLMRFRTDVGVAKDTGRVILVTVVGLCCGLKIYVVAVLATVVGFIVIHVLEQVVAGSIIVGGLETLRIPRVALAYRAALTEVGCTIVREQAEASKGRVIFVLRAPARIHRQKIAARLDNMPEDTRGVVEFEGI